MVRIPILSTSLVVLGSSIGTVLAVTPVCSLASASRLAALKTSSSTTASTLGSPTYANIAETVFTTYINYYYSTSGRYLYASYGSTGTYSNYWNTAIAIQALLDYATFHNAHGIGGLGWGAATVVATVQDIVNTQKTLSGEANANLENGYNDDMSWMIHGLTKLYNHTSSATYVTMAQTLFDQVKLSDDTTCCGSYKGGVWWDTAHTSKATAAQLGITVAALKLGETGASTEYTKAQYLSYAQSHYSFWTSTPFTNRANGQIVDHEDTAGALTWWGFDYNNGLGAFDPPYLVTPGKLICTGCPYVETGIGAAVHLYLATGTASYLTDAALFTSYLLSSAQTVTVNGASVQILANNCGGCDGDCSQFHQVAMQYLMDYYNVLYNIANANKATTIQAQVDAACNLYEFLQHNVDALYNLARDTTKGSVNCNWNQLWNGQGTDGLQGSMNSAVSATSLFASLPVWVN
ncbi:hypothetical protein FRB95_013002 [Tulasnella sp. JGI-2019a]|nr:hypothetical protein FRB95_013002 [Tulasnella sp. JGI-2019a]